MTAAFTHLLNIEHPVVQAPMAGVSTPELAAAVSNAGGLGSVGVGAGTAEQAREVIRATRALTDRPFNVNLFCHHPARPDREREAAWLEHLRSFFEEFSAQPPTELREIYTSFLADRDMFEMLLEERPPVVSFHFGLPPQTQIKALKDASIHLLASATTAQEAGLVEQAGIDAIVVQGVEAGGHRGLFEPDLGDPGISTLDLVRVVSRQSPLPVIAAGGIMDGGDIRQALDLGASAAQLGTAFILCPESAAPAAYRQNLKNAGPGATQITSAFSGRPARGLVNRLIREIGIPAAPRLPDYPIAYDAAKALHAAAAKQGSHAFAAHWAGQGAARAREMPAAVLVRTLVEELQQGQ